MAFTDSIKFDTITPELFDTIAMDVAKLISEDGRNKKNKSTQLRKYYDELCLWEQKIKIDESKYYEYLPLIKMLNAKVAYAKGRDLVDQNFVDLMRCCLGQLKLPSNPEDAESKKKSLETFKNCKLFFEAFMGFYKMYQPK